MILDLFLCFIKNHIEEAVISDLAGCFLLSIQTISWSRVIIQCSIESSHKSVQKLLLSEILDHRRADFEEIEFSEESTGEFVKRKASFGHVIELESIHVAQVTEDISRQVIVYVVLNEWFEWLRDDLAIVTA